MLNTLNYIRDIGSNYTDWAQCAAANAQDDLVAMVALAAIACFAIIIIAAACTGNLVVTNRRVHHHTIYVDDRQRAATNTSWGFERGDTSSNNGGTIEVYANRPGSHRGSNRSVDTFNSLPENRRGGGGTGAQTISAVQAELGTGARTVTSVR